MLQLFAGTLFIVTVLYAWRRLRIELAKLDEEEGELDLQKSHKKATPHDEIETLIIDEETGIYRKKEDKSD